MKSSLRIHPLLVVLLFSKLGEIIARCTCDPGDSACQIKCNETARRCIIGCNNNVCYSQCLVDHWFGVRAPSTRSLQVNVATRSLHKGVAMNEDIPPLHSMDSQEPHVSLSEASKGDEAPPHDTTGAAETAEITETVEITVKQPTPTAETTPVAIVVSERESAITRTSTGDTLSLESKALDIKTTEPRIPHTILLDPMVTRTTIVFPTEAVTTDRSIVMPLTPSVAATTTVLGAPSLVVSSTDRKETVPATTQTIAMAVASSPSSTSSMGSVLVSASVSASVSTSVSASVSASSSIASLSTVPVISATKVSEIVLSSTLPSFLVHLSVSAPSAPSAPSSTPLSSLSSLSSSVATPQVSSLRPSSTVNVSTPTQRPYPTAVTESQSYGIRDTPHFTVLMAIVFLLVLFHY